MIKEYNYINIREVLNRLLKHPLLQDTTLEQVVQYTVDFISIFGLPKMYKDVEEVLHIDNYRAKLPCDIVAINQIKDCNTNTCLRSMTDSFSNNSGNLTFKTQGSILYTSFKEGDVIISYKSLPTDEDGFPYLIDNPVFLRALELYIKKELFTILFDVGKLNTAILQNTQQQYAWAAGQLKSEFTIPSISEMESIKNMWCSLIQRNNKFSDGFSRLGDKETLKI